MLMGVARYCTGKWLEFILRLGWHLWQCFGHAMGDYALPSDQFTCGLSQQGAMDDLDFCNRFSSCGSQERPALAPVLLAWLRFVMELRAAFVGRVPEGG
jgi:hypothetical protein